MRHLDEQEGVAAISADDVERNIAIEDKIRVEELRHLQGKIREIERRLFEGDSSRQEMASQFRALEEAVRTLSENYSRRQEDSEKSLLLIARALKEQFEEHHRFKCDMMAVAAHVDRWTKRVERLFSLLPISLLKKLRRPKSG